MAAVCTPVVLTAETGEQERDMDTCAAIGPRGGKCTRKAMVLVSKARSQDTVALDFCVWHNLDVQDGARVYCSKCGDYPTASRHVGE